MHRHRVCFYPLLDDDETTRVVRRGTLLRTVRDGSRPRSFVRDLVRSSTRARIARRRYAHGCAIGWVDRGAADDDDDDA